MILEENSFKDFGENLFQIFWRKFVSKILEDIYSKDFGGKLFQRFWSQLFQRFWRNEVNALKIK